MPGLEDLPTDILYHIYEFIFRDLFVGYDVATHLGPPDNAQRKSHSTRRMSRALTRTLIPLSQTSMFFRDDPGLLDTFFHRATFVMSSEWQWQMFKRNLMSCRKLDLGCCSRISSIQFTKLMLREIEEDILDPLLLPNLSKIHLTIFEQPDTAYRMIRSRCDPHESIVEPTNSNDEPCPPSPETYHQCKHLGSICNHEINTHAGFSGRLAMPVKFALESVIAERTFDTGTFSGRVNQSFEPSGFINDNFFNDFTFVHGFSRMDDCFRYECNIGRSVKNKILEGGLRCQLPLKLLFDTTSVESAAISPMGTVLSVDAMFPTDDWMLRYVWEDVEYNISQYKPTGFDPVKKRFV